jgi:hypothetical protein
MSRCIKIAYGLKEDGRLISRKKVFEIVKEYLLPEVWEDSPFVVNDDDDIMKIALTGKSSNFKLPDGKWGFRTLSFEVADDKYDEVFKMLESKGYILRDEGYEEEESKYGLSLIPDEDRRTPH